jgi:hypothetical protein
MREHEPVFYDRADDIYGISLRADIMAISKDAETYCSGRGFRPDAPNLPMMINMERPEHMTRRNLVNRGDLAGRRGNAPLGDTLPEHDADGHPGYPAARRRYIPGLLRSVMR